MRRFIHLLLVLCALCARETGGEALAASPAPAKEIAYPLAPADREEFRQRVEKIQRGMTVKEALRAIQPLRNFPQPVWDIPGNNSFSQDLGEGWSLRLDFADAAAGGLLTAATLRPPVQQQHQPVACELILTDDRISFDVADGVELQVLVRNLGDKTLVATEVLRGLTLRRNDKTYEYGPRAFSVMRAPQRIDPSATWKIPFRLVEFGAADAPLAPGPHTISLKSADAESNAITVLLRKAEEASGQAPDRGRTALPSEKTAPQPEIILEATEIAFESAAKVSSQLLVRNVGNEKLQAAPEWYWGLVLVWDGKEYERDPQHKTAWNGPAEILPRSAWRSAISQSEYRVPAEMLSEGRHTMGLQSGKTKSNLVSITIGKAKRHSSP